MDEFYHTTCTKIDEQNADPDYLLGWQGGYLGHPEREEQRVTEAYTAGYADGREKTLNNVEKWIKK